MKKNLFEIKSEEILRILSLHEESTKKQYLNVLNEQNLGTIKKTHLIKIKPDAKK